jgi:hypothetical protein
MKRRWSLESRGWTQTSPGEFYRGDMYTDPTQLIYIFAPGFTVKESTALLTKNLGLEAFPGSTGEYESAD